MNIVRWFIDLKINIFADLDFLDLIVEMKRVRASDTVTVRIAQLGLDTIDVYLDDRYLGSVRPAMEIQVTSPAD